MARAKDRLKFHKEVESGKPVIEVPNDVLKSLLDGYEELIQARNMRDNLMEIVLESHPWPWRIDFDWGEEVLDANNKRVELYPFRQKAVELVALAERIHAQNEADRIQMDEYCKREGIG